MARCHDDIVLYNHRYVAMSKEHNSAMKHLCSASNSLILTSILRGAE